MPVTERTAPLDVIAERISEPSAQGISRAISALITGGTIRTGDRLPTVRAMAQHLGVSTSTVAAAWRTLAEHGVIETNRRRGSVVRSQRAELDGRYWQVPVPIGTLANDLSRGTPDVDLLPDVGALLASMPVAALGVDSYVQPPVLPELRDALIAAWPVEPEQLTVVDGALDALDRTVAAIVRLGDVVVVEDPTFPPLLDMLELAGAEVIGVPLDDDGLLVEPLRDALDRAPVALFTQPRAHNPTGTTWSQQRARAVADAVLDCGSQPWLVEDDHSALAAGVGLHSLAAQMPARSIFIRSFSKSHGPDLRIAAIGGAAEPIAAIERRRALGPSWTSRLLQQLLARMLHDDATIERVASAAATYANRRSAFVDALVDRGFELPVGSGLNVALPVANEQSALVYLAAHGVGAAPGTPFMVDRSQAPFVRLSVGMQRGDAVELAEICAAATRAR